MCCNDDGHSFAPSTFDFHIYSLTKRKVNKINKNKLLNFTIMIPKESFVRTVVRNQDAKECKESTGSSKERYIERTGRSNWGREID